MALTIIDDYRMEALADDLAAFLKPQRLALNNPFQEISVVVPNRNLAKWLQLYWAKKQTLCAGLQFPFIEKALWDLGKTTLKSSGPHTRLLTAEVLQQAIAATIIQCRDPRLKRFFRYCAPNHSDALKGQLDQPDCARRLWQLSGKLAAYFREYDFQRPDQVKQWLLTESASWFREGTLTEAQQEMESAQRVLYRILFGPDGVFGTRAGTASLPALLEAIPDSPATDAPLDTIHFLGLSSLSPLYVRLIGKLSRHYDIRLYHFNVCMEYWEDIQSPWQRIRNATMSRTAQGEEELDLTIENELLNAWGAAGRETMKLLSQLDENQLGGTERLLETEKEPQSVLQTIQHSIRKRTSTLRKRPQDDSLQVVACPGIRREVEMVHNSILNSLLTESADQGDPRTGMRTLAHRPNGLLLTDIAVLVPDMAAYQSTLQAVFDARDQIPYNLMDSNASRESLYGKALLMLLQLAGGPFSRRAVFEVLYNPCLQAGLKVTRADVDQWLTWVDTLGVFHSVDAAHRHQQGLPENTRFTWQQALARLRLGRLIDDPGITGERFGPPYTDIHSGSNAALRWSVSLEHLFRRLQALNGQTHTCREWKERVEGIMSDFLDIPPGHAAEAGVRNRIHESLALWAAAPNGLSGFLGEEEVPLTLIHQYLEDVMVATPCRHGAYLTGGVTIASLQPMRPIPFKQVYVLGLGEGGFPGTVERSSLDLRAIHKRIGDTNRPDTQRHLFLETLMTTRERLVLSYVAEDIKKDEKQYPGSILKQLKRFTETQVLEGEGPVFREITVPLDEADERSVTGAEFNPHDVVRTCSIYARILYLLRQPGVPTADRRAQWDQVLTSVSTVASGSALAPQRALCSKSSAVLAVTPHPPLRKVVTIKELSKFLEDPTQAVLERQLKLYHATSDADLHEDEPLQTVFPHTYTLTLATLAEFVRERGDQEKAKTVFEKEYLRLRQASLAPDGLYAELDRDQLWGELHARMEQSKLADWLKNEVPPQPLVMGEGVSHDRPPDPNVVACSLTLDDGYTVHLTGTQEFWWPATGTRVETIMNLTTSRKGSGKLPGKHVFEPLLALLAQRAVAETTRTTPFSVVIAYRDQLDIRLFKDLSPERARMYLEELAKAYFNVSTLHTLLPYPVIRSESGNEWEPLVDTAPSPETEEQFRQKVQEKVEAEWGSRHAREYTPSDVVRLIFDKLALPDPLLDVLRARYHLPWSGQPVSGMGSLYQ